jgi:predicted HicB family RNase H-like nuclease
MNTIEYKGYVGSVELDTGRNVLRGEVINIDDVVTYEGSTVAGLIKEFHKSIEVYLEFCRKRGEQPNKPYSGKFLVRITPDLHREVSMAALTSGKSLNSWVSESLELAVHSNTKETLTVLK